MRAALTPVVLAALLLVAGCGGGGGGSAASTRPTVEGLQTQQAKGAWIFHPAGTPKRLIIFFHGQGDETESTPANHRPRSPPTIWKASIRNIRRRFAPFPPRWTRSPGR